MTVQGSGLLPPDPDPDEEMAWLDAQEAKELSEVERIAANHKVLVKLLEALAEYGDYLWRQNAYVRSRSIAKGMQDHIHQAFDRLELKQ